MLERLVDNPVSQKIAELSAILFLFFLASFTLQRYQGAVTADRRARKDKGLAEQPVALMI